MIIEQKLAIGIVGATVIDAERTSGPVHLIYTVIKRSSLPIIIGHIKEFNPKAFYSIEDVRFVSEGRFPKNTFHQKLEFNSLMGARKAKSN